MWQGPAHVSPYNPDMIYYIYPIYSVSAKASKTSHLHIKLTKMDILHHWGEVIYWCVIWAVNYKCSINDIWIFTTLGTYMRLYRSVLDVRCVCLRIKFTCRHTPKAIYLKGCLQDKYLTSNRIFCNNTWHRATLKAVIFELSTKSIDTRRLLNTLPASIT